MLRVERKMNIEGATPDEVFVVLSNPEILHGLMPRLRKASVEESSDKQARLTLCLSINSMFGTICFAGSLIWNEPDEVIFRVKNPLNAEIRWIITPSENGSLVTVKASLDLKPLLGPMAHFVPQDIVRELMGKEFDHALRQIAVRVEEKQTQEGGQFQVVPVMA